MGSASVCARRYAVPIAFASFDHGCPAVLVPPDRQRQAEGEDEPDEAEQRRLDDADGLVEVGGPGSQRTADEIPDSDRRESAPDDERSELDATEPEEHAEILARRPERSPDAAHLVAAHLAVADGQLDPAQPRVGQLAGRLEGVDLTHVRGDAALAQENELAALEGEVELVRRVAPGQLLPDRVQPVSERSASPIRHPRPGTGRRDRARRSSPLPPEPSGSRSRSPRSQRPCAVRRGRRSRRGVARTRRPSP